MFKLLFPISVPFQTDFEKLAYTETENDDKKPKRILVDDLFPSTPESLDANKWESFLHIHKPNIKLYHALKTPYKCDFFLFKKKTADNKDKILGVFHFSDFADMSTYLGVPLPNALIFDIGSYTAEDITKFALWRSNPYRNVEKTTSTDRSVKYELKEEKKLRLQELLDKWLPQAGEEPNVKTTIKLGRGRILYPFNKDKKALSANKDNIPDNDTNNLLKFSFVYIPYKFGRWRTPGNLDIKKGFFWFDNFSLFDFLASKNLLLNYEGEKEKGKGSNFVPKIKIWREPDSNDIKNIINVKNGEVTLFNAPTLDSDSPDNKFAFANSLQFPFFYLPTNKDFVVNGQGDSQNWIISAKRYLANPISKREASSLSMKLIKEIKKKSNNTTNVNLNLKLLNVEPPFDINIDEPDNKHDFFIDNENNFKFKIVGFSNKDSYHALDDYWNKYFKWSTWEKENRLKLKLYIQIKTILNGLKMSNSQLNDVYAHLNQGNKNIKILKKSLQAKVDFHNRNGKLRIFEEEYKKVFGEWNSAYKKLETIYNEQFVLNVLKEESSNEHLELFISIFNAITLHPEGTDLNRKYFGNFIEFKNYKGIIKDKPLISFNDLKKVWKVGKKTYPLILWLFAKESINNVLEDIEILKLINSDKKLVTDFENKFKLLYQSTLNELSDKAKELVSREQLPMKQVLHRIPSSIPGEFEDIKYKNFDIYECEKVLKSQNKYPKVFGVFNSILHLLFVGVYSHRFVTNPDIDSGIDFFKNTSSSTASIIGELRNHLPSELVKIKGVMSNFGSILGLYSALNSFKNSSSALKNDDKYSTLLHLTSAFALTIEAVLPIFITVNPVIGLSIALIAVGASVFANELTDSDIENDFERLFFGVNYEDSNLNIRKGWEGRISFQVAILNKYFIPIGKLNNAIDLEKKLPFLTKTKDPITGENKSVLQFRLPSNLFKKGALIMVEFFYKESFYKKDLNGDWYYTNKKTTYSGFFGFYLFGKDEFLKVSVNYLDLGHSRKISESGRVRIIYNKFYNSMDVTFFKSINEFENEIDRSSKSIINTRIVSLNLLVSHQTIDTPDLEANKNDFVEMYNNYNATALTIEETDV